MTEPVTASPLVPPATGLIASANDPEAPTRSQDGGIIPAWGGGIAYEPEGCYELLGAQDPCATQDYHPPTAGEIVKWVPYGVIGEYTCRTIGSPPETKLTEFGDRARRRLLASEQKQIEQELWSGIRAQAAGWPNLWLTDGNAADLGTADALEALACLTQYLGSGLGNRGMIHATPQVVTLWAENGALYRSGALILTVATDDIVVAGRGYGGDGTGDLAFATDIIDLRRGPIETTGNTMDQVDHLRNRAIVRAQRLALASWDGCRFAQIQINNLPACEAAS